MRPLAALSAFLDVFSLNLASPHGPLFFAIVSYIRGFPGLMIRMLDPPNLITVLQSTLGALSEWELWSTCEPCRKEGRTLISRLIALQGPHQQIAEAIERLTCLPCGRKPTHVDIARTSPSPACIPLIWPNTP